MGTQMYTSGVYNLPENTLTLQNRSAINYR